MTDGMVFCAYLKGGQCFDWASSTRPMVQLLSTQAESREPSLGTSQQESPGTVGIQQRYVGSFGEGGGFLPLRSFYSWHKSEFLVWIL